MKRHRLKTLPEFWDAVAIGRKRFELRRNDRGFQPGDLIELVRLDDRLGREHMETNRVLAFKIGYILDGGRFGLEPGFCIMQLEERKPI